MEIVKKERSKPCFLCTNRKEFEGHGHSYCVHPKCTGISLNGTYPVIKTCAEARSLSVFCGPDGEYFNRVESIEEVSIA